MANDTQRYTMPDEGFKRNVQVELKILDERLKDGTFPLPQYESSMAAGVDLRAMITEDKILNPQETFLMPTGIAVYMKDPNLCATVLPRSGLG